MNSPQRANALKATRSEDVTTQLPFTITLRIDQTIPSAGDMVMVPVDGEVRNYVVRRRVFFYSEKARDKVALTLEKLEL